MLKYILTIFVLIQLIPAQSQNDASQPDFLINHAYMIVDSVTYEAVINSVFVQNEFAYVKVRQLKNYKGLYLFGKENYFEIFNPKSLEEDVMDIGTAGICLSSLQQGKVNEVQKRFQGIYDLQPETDSVYKSIYVPEHPVCKLTMWTWEFIGTGYKELTNKELVAKQRFSHSEYFNEYDLSFGAKKLIKEISGIRVLLNSQVLSGMTKYLEASGYKLDMENGRYSNGKHFFEMRESVISSAYVITDLYFNLNRPVKMHEYKIGKTVLTVDGETAQWHF